MRDIFMPSSSHGIAAEVLIYVPSPTRHYLHVNDISNVSVDYTASDIIPSSPLGLLTQQTYREEEERALYIR